MLAFPLATEGPSIAFHLPFGHLQAGRDEFNSQSPMLAANFATGLLHIQPLTHEKLVIKQLFNFVTFSVQALLGQ